MKLITLEETLKDQQNLDNLCRDRPLKTNEICAANSFYGIDSILKYYCGLSNSYVLKVVYPHGSRSDDYIWKYEIDSPLPAIVAYTQTYYELLVEANQDIILPKKVYFSAFPFLYAIKLLNDFPKPNRIGTIFFPTHSTHHFTATVDFEGLADKLVKLDSQYQPVTVCMYWKDFILESHLPFLKRGLKVVSAGHMFDPLFYLRFYHLCSIHQYSSGNSFGSHFAYSVKAGCAYFHLGGFPYSIKGSEEKLKQIRPSYTNLYIKDYEFLFHTPVSTASKEQLNFADNFLGTQYILSPLELKQRFLDLDGLEFYKYYFPAQMINFLKRTKRKVTTWLTAKT